VNKRGRNTKKKKKKKERIGIRVQQRGFEKYEEEIKRLKQEDFD
jgi:dissimilatory sulfite reductase (desulfoviridin) alpha/beta subunit